MWEKNICRGGRFRAVHGPCFAVEAFQTCTECHERNDAFPRQSGTRGSGRWLALPVGLLELSAWEPPAHPYVSTDHVTRSQGFCSSSGNRRNSEQNWHVTKEVSGKREHGLEQERQGRAERGHIFALCSAVVATFNHHEEILLSGKDHGIKLSVLESRDRVWVYSLLCEPHTNRGHGPLPLLL